MRFIVLIFISLLLVFSPPADAWASKKKYAEYIASLPPEGDRPTPEYVQRSVIAYFKFTLKDAESAKYEWGSIENGTWKGAFERYGSPGWIATVHVNGKNSYGAYSGFTEFKFIFRSGSIVEIYEYNQRQQGWVPTIGIKGKPIPALP